MIYKEHDDARGDERRDDLDGSISHCKYIQRKYTYASFWKISNLQY